MSATDVHDTSRDASVGRVDMKLEVMIIPVSDDRSKEFYERPPMTSSSAVASR